MQPDNTPSEPDPLGRRYRAYRPSRISTIGGTVLGLLLLAVGVVPIIISLSVAHDNGWDFRSLARDGSSWAAVVGANVVGMVFVCTGLWLAKSSLKQTSYSVDLRTEGFRVHSGGRQEEVLWADVHVMQQVTQYLRVRGSVAICRMCRVLVRSGKVYDFDGDLRGFDELAKILREVARQRSITWEKIEDRA
jgi:hypothetical protein